MKALLLAAGLGTRMKPFTFFKAKACLPLLNVPFLHYPLQYLRAVGITDIVINLHAHPESVRSAAKQFPGQLDLQFSFEPEILGTAGAIRKALGTELKEPFLVMNSDMLMDIPLDKVMLQHKRLEADITMVLMEEKEFSQYGKVYFEMESGSESPLRFAGIHEGTGTGYHYTGLQIINPGIVELIAPDKKSELFKDIYLSLIGRKRIYGFVYESFWHEAGTLKEYLKTSLHLLKNPLPVHLQPPGMQGTLISPSAAVEEGGVIADSIIMEGATVRKGVHVERSIIGWDVVVSRSVRDMAIAKAILPWPI